MKAKKAGYISMEENKWFSLKQEVNGEEYIYSASEALVVPLTTDNAVLFSIEYSPAFGQSVLILPGGTVEPDESHAEAANRELQEELGYKSLQLDFLGEVWPWSKYLNVRTYLYLGRELIESKLEGDEKEQIHTEKAPLAECDSLITSGRLRDARTIAALALTRAYLAQHPR